MTDQASPQIQTTTTSARGAVNWKDMLTVAEYGGLTGVLGALGSAADSVTGTNHIFSIDPKVVLSAFVVGAIAALVQKFKAPQQTIVTNPQDIPAVNAAAAGLPIIQTKDDSEPKPDKAS